MNTRFIKIEGYLEVPVNTTPNILCLDLTPALKEIGVINFKGTISNREDCMKEDEVNHVTIL
jgi:hypothetical protein